MGKKIFEFSGGSFLDKVSGALSINGGGEFQKTEKGLAWKGVSGITLASPITLDRNSATLEVWFKGWSIGADATIVGTSNTQSYLGAQASGSLLRLESDTNTVYWLDALSASFLNDLKYNWNHLVIIATSGQIKSYLNGILIDDNAVTDDFTITYIGRGASDFWSDYIGRVQIYDHPLIAKERANLYADFLRAGPVTRKVVDNLTYPRPLVNHDPGCLAHWNFIPS